MVVLVGGVALQFPPADRVLFGFGVGLVSPLWFFGLVVGGRHFAGVFARPMAMSAFDIGSGVMMLVLAAMIIDSKLSWM